MKLLTATPARAVVRVVGNRRAELESSSWNGGRI
jgi:hypothetical protein